MKTYLIAIGIFIVLSIWMLTGMFKSTPEAATETVVASQSKAPTQVRTRTITIENKELSVSLRGRTEAKRIVDVHAEISGKLISTPIEKGQRVKKGDVLCELSEEDRAVQLSRAKASFEKAQIDFDGSKKLFDDGMISSAALAASKSALENERAALKTAQLNVDHLQMRAPFDAFVEDRPAQVGALIERGQICARLIDESTLLASGQATEKNIQQLNLGQKAIVKLADNREYPASISFIGRTADSLTRTYKLEVTINDQNHSIRDGITAQIIIPLNEVKAHHISPSVLALDGEGNLGVRIVNNEDKVELIPVSVVDESIDGVWITGLPETVRLIVVGQELVSHGDSVSVLSLDNRG